MLAETRSREGMVQAAEVGFETVLRARLADIGTPAGVPILICGMAGARQGWIETPYVVLPTEVTGLAARATRVGTALGDVRILPGLCQTDHAAPDVMRGEETQLLGLGLDADSGGMLVCMPGTHCKWVELVGGTVRRFSTHMTGELFDLLGRHSVLKHVVASDVTPHAGDPAFLTAAERALTDRDALVGLFALRASRLLGFSERATGAAELSGLLIGTDIAAARRGNPSYHRVTLVASGTLADLYEPVLERAGFTVTLADAEAATRRGLWPAS